MKYLILLFSLLAFSPAQAAIEAYEFKDDATESLYKELIEELRCLVCQNQNLADSNAELALDLRKQTYDMLQQGKNREEIVDYMVNRYGDFVLYRPPVKSSTYLLWAGPFALLLIVLIAVLMHFKKKQTLQEPEQQALNQARDLLSGGSTDSKGDSK